MTYRGTVRGGMVELPAEVTLPDGTEVVIVVSETATPRAESGIWGRLAALGRWAETQPSDLPPDLAENHDHYLHGQPKLP
jgi:hypothetical protein